MASESESVVVRYTGSPSWVSMLAAEIREAGYDVEYEPPIESRGGTIPEPVLTILTVTGHPAVWGPLMFAVHAFRKRHEGEHVEIDGVDETDYDDDDPVS